VTADTGETAIDGVSGRLAAKSARVEEIRAELAQAMTERDTLVFEAVDVFGLSHRKAARALGLTRSRLEGILANGHPSERQ
jgi:DNA-directed RNA polymerase specialized sigma24 family protein